MSEKVNITIDTNEGFEAIPDDSGQYTYIMVFGKYYRVYKWAAEYVSTEKPPQFSAVGNYDVKINTWPHAEPTQEMKDDDILSDIWPCIVKRLSEEVDKSIKESECHIVHGEKPKKKSKWHRVDDEMPPQKVVVLCQTDEYEEELTAYYSMDKWFCYPFDNVMHPHILRVTHWRKLPKGPDE